MTTPTMRELTVPAAVRRFLHGLETGDWDGMEDDLAEDALYDASVPGWHYQYEGARRVVQEYREEWSGKYVWSVVERHVAETADGVVLDIEMHGRPLDQPTAESPAVVSRLANFFRLEGDRIAEHRYYCCGEWDAETVRHIREHAPKVEARTS